MNHQLNLTLTNLTYNLSLHDFLCYYYWEPPIRFCNSLFFFLTSSTKKIRISVLYSKHLQAETIKKSVFRILTHENNIVCGIDNHAVYCRLEADLSLLESAI